MKSINFKNIIVNTAIVLLIFFLDRISKNYIINLAEMQNLVDIYLTSYLNLYLIWNNGIAFGLFSSDVKSFYDLFTLIIIIVNIIIIVMIIKSNNFTKNFLLIILGGSFGNLFDRIYYNAVPDFIDLHIGNFHWFVFNIADIFITIGVICLITAEMLTDKNINNEKY